MSRESTSVSPMEAGGDVDEDSGGEEPIGDFEGERIGLPREGEHIRKVLDPKLPSQEEVDMHYLMGHIPYRNWCHICVRTRGKELDHKADSGKERRLPEYSWDYCFPGDELGFKWTVLVGKERMGKGWMATTVPSKGGYGTVRGG